MFVYLPICLSVRLVFRTNEILKLDLIQRQRQTIVLLRAYPNPPPFQSWVRSRSSTYLFYPPFLIGMEEFWSKRRATLLFSASAKKGSIQSEYYISEYYISQVQQLRSIFTNPKILLDNTQICKSPILFMQTSTKLHSAQRCFENLDVVNRRRS